MSSNPTEDPLVGRLIDGRYEVRSRIARGGMATVYLATDLRLDRRVAVKVMHPHLADDDQFKERFIQEARSAARLAHPNVVNVFDQGQEAETAYLVMEYLPGITLRDLLQEYGRLTPEQMLDISEAVLAGLAAAHRAGIVHRDLKPENVILADDGRIKIGDFGLARAVSANTATGQALLGTIAYLSPELVTRGVADTRSDIYAVGIMMYEMLAGEQPFKGEQPMQIAYQHANDNVPPPSDVVGDVPAELDELVLWATAREPDSRPRDARSLLEQVTDARRIVVPEATQPHAVISTAATAAYQPTRVLAPVAGTDEISQGLTQVLSPARNGTGPLDGGTGEIDEGSDEGGPRKRRGRLIALIVVLVLLLGGGGATAWYLLAGPGSYAAVPTLVGSTEQDARSAIEDAGFAVGSVTPQTSLDVPAGEVMESSPGAGTHLPPESEIDLIVSAGPRLIALPEFTGRPADDVRGDLGDFQLQDDVIEFNADIAEGAVIRALGVDASGGSIGLEAGQEYAEQQSVTLVVSAGPVPSVTGETTDSARGIIEGAGLEFREGERRYDNDVAEGRVIDWYAQVDEGEPVVPGTAIVVNVSDGPEPVQVPDVVGDNVDDAVAALEAAGLQVAYSDPGPFGSFATVTEISPGAGQEARVGDTITLRWSLTG